MQKLAVKLILATLLTGVVAAALRLWELQTVFDPETGLAEQYAPQSLLLLALCLLFALVLLFVCLRLRRAGAADGYEHALRGPGVVAPVLSVLLLALMLPAAFLCYKAGRASGSTLAMGILALFAAAAAVSYLDLSFSALRRRGGAELCLACVLITMFICYWLIMAYKERAADPVLLDYIYDFLALCSGALASYYIAGYAFGRGSVAKTVYFSLLSAMFSCIAIVGQSDVYAILFYVFLLLHLLMSCFALLCNSRMPDGRDEAPPEGSEDADTQNDGDD